MNGAESSEHANVVPLSVAENAKVADVELVGPVGPDVIVVSGAAASTVTWTAAEELDVLPAASEAVAVYVCVPSPTDVKVVCHAPPEPAVTVATCVAPSSSFTSASDSAAPDTATEELVCVLLSAGLEIVGAAGATVSTVHDRVAGD
jgi:hypothetical protein